MRRVAERIRSEALVRVAENEDFMPESPGGRSMSRALQTVTQPAIERGTKTSGARLGKLLTFGIQPKPAGGKLHLSKPSIWSLLLLLLLVVADAGAQQSVTFRQVVRQADAGLRWMVTPEVPFGIAVGEPQLTASARVHGAFTYTPAAGTMLEPGRHTIKVTFQPFDSNYHPDEATFAVTVRPPGKSTFRVRIASPLAGRNLIILSRANEVTLQLEISPVGDFHQPVTLACAPASGITCLFTPSIVRPTSAPEAVAMVVRWAAPQEPALGSEAPRELSQQLSGPRWRPSALPGAASAVVLLLLLPAADMRRHRRSNRLGLAWTLALLCAAVPIFGQCLGCGDPSQSESLTIKATSLVESRLLDATVVIQR